MIEVEVEVEVEDVDESAGEAAPVAEAPEASWVDEGGALGPDGNGGDAGDASDDGAGSTGDEDPIDLEAEAEAAADLLEGLLDALDLDGDLQIRILDDHAEVEITDAGEGVLIGRRGQTLDAIQELTRSALQRRFQRRAHVVVDVDGYRARRVERLLERADEAIEEVRSTGEAQRLEPMDAFERKIVHQRVAEAGGLASHSSGRDPARRVIIERD
jgi:spoIIIJ-associated protein